MRRIAVLAALAVGFTSTPSGSAVPALQPCATRQLRISVVRTGVAAGTVGGYLAFTNRLRTVCTLRGWPRLTAVRPGATATAVRVHETMFGPYTKVRGIWRFVRGVPTVTLRQGHSAVAAFTVGDHGVGPTGACPPPYRRLRVSPPGNTTSVFVSAWIAYYAQFLPSCTRLAVSMVVPASGMPPRG